MNQVTTRREDPQAFIEKNINIKSLNKKRQISQQPTLPTKSDKSLNDRIVSN